LWELGISEAGNHFSEPKLIYQEIQFHPSYALERNGFISNNKTSFCPRVILPAGDSEFAADVVHNWRCLPHMKDEALTPVAFVMERLPIAQPAIHYE